MKNLRCASLRCALQRCGALRIPSLLPFFSKDFEDTAERERESALCPSFASKNSFFVLHARISTKTRCTSEKRDWHEVFDLGESLRGNTIGATGPESL